MLEQQIQVLEKRFQRVTVPLCIRNKATQIENQLTEIKGTVPEPVLKKTQAFDKPIVERQYRWMELLKRVDNMYIRQLVAALETTYLKMQSGGLTDSYEKFKSNFCYALATLISVVNENIAHYE